MENESPNISVNFIVNSFMINEEEINIGRYTESEIDTNWKDGREREEQPKVEKEDWERNRERLKTEKESKQAIKKEKRKKKERKKERKCSELRYTFAGLKVVLKET